MDNNQQTIIRFYEAFKQLEASDMVACYHTAIKFYDPVFGLLEGQQMVGGMWHLLCARATAWSLTYTEPKNIGDGYYTCQWVACYQFGPKKRRVINRIMANFKMEDGVILEHSDAFSLHRWSAQAYGIGGWFFGWTGPWQRKVQLEARRKLFSVIENTTT